VLYNVNVSASDGKGGNMNQSVQIEALNMLDAIEKAKSAFTETIRLSGLQVVPPAPEDPAPTP